MSKSLNKSVVRRRRLKASNSPDSIKVIPAHTHGDSSSGAVAPTRCPCYARIPSASCPAGTPCREAPLGSGVTLCRVHHKMFVDIDRRAVRDTLADAHDDSER